jgi:hypothetical protein
MPPECRLQVVVMELSIKTILKLVQASCGIGAMKNIADVARTVAFVVMGVAVIASTVASLMLS